MYVLPSGSSNLLVTLFKVFLACVFSAALALGLSNTACARVFCLSKSASSSLAAPILLVRSMCSRFSSLYPSFLKKPKLFIASSFRYTGAAASNMRSSLANWFAPGKLDPGAPLLTAVLGSVVDAVSIKSLLALSNLALVSSSSPPFQISNIPPSASALSEPFKSLSSFIWPKADIRVSKLSPSGPVPTTLPGF